MNHIYSIVSSNPQSAGRVAPETAKRRGKRGSNVGVNGPHHALSAAVLGALALMVASPALAQQCPGSGSITGPRTTTCTLGNNDNLTIESSGSVIVTGIADALVVPTATTVTIQNNGTVSSNTVGIRIAGNVQSLTNAAGYPEPRAIDGCARCPEGGASLAPPTVAAVPCLHAHPGHIPMAGEPRPLPGLSRPLHATAIVLLPILSGCRHLAAWPRQRRSMGALVRLIRHGL